MYDSLAIFKSHKSTRQKQKVQTVLDERAPQLILVIQIICKFRKAAGDVSDKNETSDLRSPVVYKDFSGVCIKFGQMTEQTNNKFHYYKWKLDHARLMVLWVLLWTFYRVDGVGVDKFDLKCAL